jgi:hypothetical protein
MKRVSCSPPTTSSSNYCVQKLRQFSQLQFSCLSTYRTSYFIGSTLIGSVTQQMMTKKFSLFVISMAFWGAINCDILLSVSLAESDHENVRKISIVESNFSSVQRGNSQFHSSILVFLKVFTFASTRCTKICTQNMTQ